MFINSLDDLRKLAVKHILRKAPADYLLRHSLCKPWVASTHLDEMAWTDFKSLFFNFPKLRAQLDSWHGDALDPGDTVNAHLAAVCHEILHVLWLHRIRGKGKNSQAWRVACEWAINYELAKLFGSEWIEHLNVMHPNSVVMESMELNRWPHTTDGFYEYLTTVKTSAAEEALSTAVQCKHCNRPYTEDEPKPEDMVKVLVQLPESEEKSDILRYITAHQVPEQKVPWEMLLLGGIENAVNQEQSWAVPSRRNELLPGWRHEKLLSFVWILDVSPSIDDEMKQSFMNTLQAGINLYHDAQHRVIFFADDIVADIVVSSGTNLNQFEIPCGSGTDLTDVWTVLERDLPEYALVLTDLELSEVPKPSYTKIVWGIVGNYRMFDPDYGIKIELK